ncbi:MAG: hypothetical protein DRO39_01010 [Thermoprotei archaeon]|nr:MAG: hypothetical protein DRO39_01010 [Thermoprotei archaeon]
MKTKGFLYATSWIEHFRRVSPRRRRGYLRKFSRYFTRISQYLEHTRIFRETNALARFIELHNPAVVLIDNKLVNNVQHINALIIPESLIRLRHHARLMLVADNLANYFRIVLRDRPKIFREELKRFEK